MAVGAYKEAGGGYEGRKSDDNHLKEWTDQDWGTTSGRQSGKTGERYLPRRAREHLSKDEYARTTEKKRRDTREGRQFSKQPKIVARKTKPYRESGGSEKRARRSPSFTRVPRTDGLTGARG